MCALTKQNVVVIVLDVVVVGRSDSRMPTAPLLPCLCIIESNSTRPTHRCKHLAYDDVHQAHTGGRRSNAARVQMLTTVVNKKTQNSSCVCYQRHTQTDKETDADQSTRRHQMITLRRQTALNRKQRPCCRISHTSLGYVVVCERATIYDKRKNIDSLRQRSPRRA